MAAADTLYAARFAGPEFFERGRSNTPTCPVYRDGALVVPTSGTVTITKPDGTALVSAAAVTVVSSVARYTVLAAVLAGQALGEGWHIEWALDLPGEDEPITFKRSALVGRCALYPVITDADLYRKRSELRGLLGEGESYQDDIDEAFGEICHWLRQGGSLPHLIMSPEDLRYVELYLSLANAYGRFTTSPAGTSEANWPEQASEFRTLAEAEFKRLSLKYDMNDDGKPDTQRRPARPVTFLAEGGDDYWPGVYPWP